MIIVYTYMSLNTGEDLYNFEHQQKYQFRESSSGDSAPNLLFGVKIKYCNELLIVVPCSIKLQNYSTKHSNFILMEVKNQVTIWRR